ncbi:phosphonate C-P lyase system protein PhnH [Paenibacillus gorillae]|uniref:phosphonate C-P lyase system protein PhnH n=1 Tax=Paenibacillus gorillae TaxID=1243662 RepID=UPI0004B56B3A|nr:phosphonate C-P lyase system protein PhnH [Paenibacillus gorillae]
MSLDMVHDIQIAYRQLVDAMSRPGYLADITEEAGKLNPEPSMLPATQILARMLLDTEVSFGVVSEREAEAVHLLNQLTYANETTLEAADFIFVLSDATPEQLLQVLKSAKIGELQDPHRSATIIIETPSLTGGSKLQLSGPGIRTVAEAEIQLNEAWIDIRGERNAEFPLGLDLIFTDSANRLLALPRTAQVAKEEIR